jgi:hypothetical protein
MAYVNNKSAIHGSISRDNMYINLKSISFSYSQTDSMLSSDPSSGIQRKTWTRVLQNFVEVDQNIAFGFFSSDSFRLPKWIAYHSLFFGKSSFVPH